VLVTAWRAPKAALRKGDGSVRALPQRARGDRTRLVAVSDVAGSVARIRAQAARINRLVDGGCRVAASTRSCINCRLPGETTRMGLLRRIHLRRPHHPKALTGLLAAAAGGVGVGWLLSWDPEPPVDDVRDILAGAC
jgi:hypothetical protein